MKKKDFYEISPIFHGKSMEQIAAGFGLKTAAALHAWKSIPLERAVKFSVKNGVPLTVLVPEILALIETE